MSRKVPGDAGARSNAVFVRIQRSVAGSRTFPRQIEAIVGIGAADGSVGDAGGAGVAEGIDDLGAALLYEAIRDGIEIPDVVVAFRGEREVVITDAGVDVHARADAPRVLRITAEGVRAEA